jgi:alpha-beta hydrolase superfamily lysophospholipase
LARKWIEAAHPGTHTFALELYEGLASLTDLDEQVKTVTAYVANLTSSMPSVFQNGYHIIGHSQGGLLMRCVIENFDAHKVDRFISLAGVVNGYFGAPAWLRASLATTVQRSSLKICSTSRRSETLFDGRHVERSDKDWLTISSRFIFLHVSAMR